MAEQNNEQGGYTPASFEKRAAAWMGIVYVLMTSFVITFAIYTGGRELPGTFPLFLAPVSVTLAVVLIRRMKLGACPGGIAGGVLGLILCAAGLGLGLALVSVALNGVTDDVLFNIPSSMLLWLMCGLIFAIRRL